MTEHEREILDLLRKEAIVFSTGGHRPTNTIGESWIGAVKWKKEGEETPLDKDGNPMIELATFFLEDLPFVPDALKNIKLVTMYISENPEPTHQSEITDDIVIRTYTSFDGLVPNENANIRAFNAFPLEANYIDNDMPVWEDIDSETIDLIDEYESEGDFDYYSLGNDLIGHKIGGYPINEEDGYQSIITIVSDETAGIGFGYDCEEALYLYYNPEINDWRVYIFKEML